MTDVQVSESEAWHEVLRGLEVLRKDLRALEVDRSSDLASSLRRDLLAIRRRVRERVAENRKGTVSIAWRRGEFSAPAWVAPGVPERIVRVSGYRAGPFGVHRQGGRFNLVHLPTGLRFISYRLLREAKQAAALLAELPIDWSEADEEKLVQPRELQDKIRQILKDCKEESRI